MKSRSMDIFWKVMAVVLATVVGVQGAILYYGMKNKKDAESVNKTEGDAILRPRLTAPVQYPAPTTAQYQAPVNTTQPPAGLRPAPLPKVNLNINNMPGIKLSNPAPQQQIAQQMQQPALTPSASPSRMMQRMSSMSGHMDMEEEFRRMQAMMNQMFSNSGRMGPSQSIRRQGFSSGLNMNVASPRLSEQGNNYVVKLTIPGLDESQVNARIRNNILTLSGAQTKEEKNKGQYGASYSRSTSSFQNSFSLPGPIKDKGLKLSYENDTLTVIIPKA